MIAPILLIALGIAIFPAWLALDRARVAQADAAILRSKLSAERGRRMQAEWSRDTLKSLLDRRAKRSVA